MIPDRAIESYRYRGIVDYIYKEYTNLNTVPVIVNKSGITSIYFFPCDKYGIPTISRMIYTSLPPLSLTVSSSIDLTTSTIRTFNETVIYIRQPLVAQRLYDHEPKTIVSLWEGEIWSSDKNIKELDVSELMELAQKVVISRENDVIKNAFINK